MIIKSLKIDNFKSLVDFKLVEPNPFTVFVGSNAAGKSNIFEALEFLYYTDFISSADQLAGLFGGTTSFVPDYLLLNLKKYSTSFNVEFYNNSISIEVQYSNIDGLIKISQIANSFNSQLGGGVYVRNNFEKNVHESNNSLWIEHLSSEPYTTFIKKFSRIFVGNSSIVKQITTDDLKIASDGSNLELVLKRILNNSDNKEEIIECLTLLVPGFERIEIKTEKLSGSDNLLIYEKGTNRPFNKKLISDGTYNLIAILTALFQSDEPQFLCIEEPENGLNPKVVKELVNLFRQKCEDEGHYIWLNTHSQTLVSQLEPKEIILVNKENGITKAKQIKNMDLHGLPMDEAWLTNALGGGIPW